MPTLAQWAYGTSLRIGDGVPITGLNIIGATNTTPIVINCSSAHSITDVSYATVASVGGTTGANGSWIVSRVDNTHLTLRGSIGNAAYTSGGTITPTDSFLQIPEMTNIEDSGLTAQLVETTAHDGNGFASRIPTFLSANTMRVSVNYIPAHHEHNASTGLLFLLRTRARRRFLLVLPDTAKTAMLWTAWVGSDRIQAPVAGALTAQVSLEVDGAPILTAA